MLQLQHSRQEEQGDAVYESLPGPQSEVPAQQCYLQYPGHRRAFRECHSIYRESQQTISATVHVLGLGTHIYII